ncbi:MAG: tetratricopeptide repeat protein, partial [Pseudomonadota bacterium]
MKALRGRDVLAVSLGALVLAYSAGFAVAVRLDPDAAWSRFAALTAAEHDARAVRYGDRALASWEELEAVEIGGTGPLLGPNDGEEEVPSDLIARRRAVADAHYRGGDRQAAVDNYTAVLAEADLADLSDDERVEINRRIAELELRLGRVQRPAIIVAKFLDRAGDAAAGAGAARDGVPMSQQHFLEMVDAFRPMFVDVLPADGSGAEVTGNQDDVLSAAEAFTRVGGYYALQAEGSYAAAGLLAVALRAREKALGPDHPDTVQTALLLASIYESIDRMSDAERLYERVFQAQERAKGSNNPELSLYIRLLVSIYEKQGRFTEAEALNQHMRKIFRDAYGARRYAANQSRDRRLSVNRPVSERFPLGSDFVPTDLVAANAFDITLSKTPELEEMRVRLAEGSGTSLPRQLS